MQRRPGEITYTSLSRLSSATNPEMGGNSLDYWYDYNGNLTEKLNSGYPGLLVSYSYDTLNRLETREYDDGTTPSVTYCYDGTIWNGGFGGCSGTPAAPEKGRLTEVGSAVSLNSYYYNAAGLITASTQTTAGQPFDFVYTYTAAYAPASETYPSGRTVTTAYDDAGRPEYLQGQIGSTTTPYVGTPSTPIQYASHGAISSMPMGNGITETRTYNSRLQPTTIQAGSLLTILNCYRSSDDPSNCSGLPVQSNNGNVQRQKITRSGQSWVQNYTYDSVNRLLSAAESGVWSQTYGYDAYGNRWLSAWSGLPVDSMTPLNQNWFDADTNRLAGTNNYDERGNQIMYGSYTLTYDGDDKVSAVSGITPSTRYEYDGEGRRVRAHSCPGSTTCTPGAGANTTIFVYDAFGKLAMEYRPTAASPGTSYYTQDHLGSTRLETNASGQPVKCSDYLPFGEEILPGYGGRSYCFGANDNKIKFTGKERDVETGLDYFGARYMSGVLGRFTSLDPIIMGPHKASNPQNWNLYVYAINNPLMFTDPTGEIIKEVIDPRYKERYEEWKKEYLSTEQGQKMWEKYGENNKEFTLTITFGENTGGEHGAQTTGYEWNDSGNLCAATIIMGGKMDSGYPSPAYYPVLSSLRPDGRGDPVSGTTLAATKLSHEFGHVEHAAATPKALFQLQNMLAPMWIKRFQATRQRSLGWERLMGGMPDDVHANRERAAEAMGTIPFLRSRFPGDGGARMPNRIKQAIEIFEKAK